jgi:hypothetical protein
MKSLIRKIATTFAFSTMLLGSSVLAQSNDNDGCSEATLNGDYAFRISGEIFVPDLTKTPPVPTTAIMAYRDGVAMTHFDGKGTLKQVDFVMGNGVPPSLQMPAPDPADIDPNTHFSTGEWGTYQVFSDCTGTATINFPAPKGMEKGNVITLMFVIANNGNTLHTVVSSLILFNGNHAFANIHSDAERLHRIEDRP